eukprot:8323983-Lingulodinium_polyedra.AAC.1
MQSQSGQAHELKATLGTSVARPRGRHKRLWHCRMDPPAAQPLRRLKKMLVKARKSLPSNPPNPIVKHQVASCSPPRILPYQHSP